MSAPPLSGVEAGRRHPRPLEMGLTSSVPLSISSPDGEKGLELGAGWAAAGGWPQPLQGLSSLGDLPYVCVTWSPMHGGNDGKSRTPTMCCP